MRTLARAVSVMLFGVMLFGVMLLAPATTAVAAQPSPGPGGRPGPLPRGPGGGGVNPIGATADFLLARTGELALTDAQVVRLAAISRRTDARRKAMMTRMDSARAAVRPAPGDSAGPRGRGRGPGAPGGPPPADMKAMQEMRDQMHGDVRDAIAVLTPDQQATAWMMIAGGPALGGRPGPMGRGFGAGPGVDGQRAERGPISRPPAPRDVPRRPEGTERTEP
jgi:hypothetical protein